MNYYEEIRTIRNEAFYQGSPPLEKDCSFYYRGKLYTCLEIIESQPFLQCFTYYDYEKNKSQYIELNAVKDIHRLGKEISLNDVLRLLEKKERSEVLKEQTVSFHFGFSGTYNFLIQEVLNKDSEDGDYGRFLDINLTKPIKDQDCLKEIYELIK
jgi:hypothetical protein